MLDRIKAGRGRLKDLDLLLEIGDTIGIMPGTTICGLADGAAWPIKNAIRKFRGEFEEYIKRTNPSGYMETEAVPALQILGGALTASQAEFSPARVVDLRVKTLRDASLSAAGRCDDGFPLENHFSHPPSTTI